MSSTTEPIPVRPRERRRRRRRRALLDCAWRIAAEGGLEALTIHELARRLDYTPGALYRYFDSRDALLVAMQLEVLREWGEALSAVRARCDEVAPEEAAARALLPVLASGALFQRFAVTQPGRFALVSHLLGVQRHLVADEAARDLVAPLLALLGQLAGDLAVAEGVALVPGRADQRALMLLAGLQGLLQLRKLRRLAPATFAPEEVAPRLVHDLLRGWGAPDAALAAADRALSALDLPGGVS